MREYESYRCEECGNIVEVQSVGGGTLVCCSKPMVCITKSLTAVNLMKAFAGESQARNKYEFFAEVAQKEGLHRIARFFQEAAEQRQIAFGHFRSILENGTKADDGIGQCRLQCFTVV